MCHAVDPSRPVRELAGELALYLAPESVPPGPLVWASPVGPRLLDPDRPIGEQVPANATIEPVRPGGS